MDIWYKEIDCDIVETYMTWIPNDWHHNIPIKEEAIDFLERINVTEEVNEALKKVKEEDDDKEIIEILNSLTYEDIPSSAKEYEDFINKRGN